MRWNHRKKEGKKKDSVESFFGSFIVGKQLQVLFVPISSVRPTKKQGHLVGQEICVASFFYGNGKKATTFNTASPRQSSTKQKILTPQKLKLRPKIQQTKMLFTCQRFGDLFLSGLIWQYSSNHKTYNKGRFKVIGYLLAAVI